MTHRTMLPDERKLISPFRSKYLFSGHLKIISYSQRPEHALLGILLCVLTGERETDLTGERETVKGYQVATAIY